MESCKSASDELGPQVLAELVGSAVVLVTDAIVTGRREGHVCISEDTAKRLTLRPSRNVTDTMDTYLPARIRDQDVTWASETPHDGEALRWKWVATPATATVTARYVPIPSSTLALGYGHSSFTIV